MGFTLRAPAKINLYLKVLNRRQDGFHNILSLMQMIDLYDTLTFHEEGTSVRLRVVGGAVPEDRSNLVLKAARILEKQMVSSRRIRKGVVITLDKKIPVSAGLGGGSSDAAATLRGLNWIWSLALSRRRLAEIGGFVGSDVPFFFYGPAAWVTGRGERVQSVASPGGGFVVLVYSGEPVSTASVYQQVEAGIPEGGALPLFEQVLAAPWNDLEKVTMGMQPALLAIKRKLVAEGGKAPLMSGSGPTVFAHFETFEQARRAALGIRKTGYPNVWVAKRLRRVPNGWGALSPSFSDSI